MLSLMFIGHSTRSSHYPNAHLVKYIDRYGDEEEGEDIGGGGDDGAYHEDDDEGVAAVATKEGGINETHLGEEPADDGELKHETHEQGEHHEGGDIGV